MARIELLNYYDLSSFDTIFDELQDAFLRYVPTISGRNRQRLLQSPSNMPRAYIIEGRNSRTHDSHDDYDFP